MNNWWLDERAYAGAEHLDARYVSGDDDKAGFDPTEDLDALRTCGLTSARPSSTWAPLHARVEHLRIDNVRR